MSVRNVVTAAISRRCNLSACAATEFANVGCMPTLRQTREPTTPRSSFALANTTIRIEATQASRNGQIEHCLRGTSTPSSSVCASINCVQEISCFLRRPVMGSISTYMLQGALQAYSPANSAANGADRGLCSDLVPVKFTVTDKLVRATARSGCKPPIPEASPGTPPHLHQTRYKAGNRSGKRAGGNTAANILPRPPATLIRGLNSARDTPDRCPNCNGINDKCT